MEQLSPEVRPKVVKMSDDRLKQKLVQAGYHEEDVAMTHEFCSIFIRNRGLQ